MGRSRSAASPTTGGRPLPGSGAIASISVFGFSPDGRYLATTHYPDFALTVWDIDRRTIAVDDPGPVPSLPADFSPDSRRIALTHQDGELLVYDLATGQPGGAGPGRRRSMTWHSVRTGPGSRSSHGRQEPDLPDPGIGDRPAGPVDRAALRTEMRSPGAPTAPRWRRRCSEIRRSTSGTPPPASARRPWKARPTSGSDRGLPPLRHAAGQQRLGMAAAALGPGPGPARAEHDLPAADGSTFSQDGRIVVCERGPIDALTRSIRPSSTGRWLMLSPKSDGL